MKTATPFNRPDLTIMVDDEDYHFLALCKWHAVKRKRSLTHYLYGCIEGQQIYLHRLIMSAPKGMTVNHVDGNALNNCRRNLEIVTQSENARHSILVLRRTVKPSSEPRINKVRKRLADGRIKIYQYERRSGELLGSYIENGTEI